MRTWQNICVKEAVVAVTIGRVRLGVHGKRTTQQLSHKPLSLKPLEKVCDHKLIQKTAEKTCCTHSALASGNVLDLRATPLPSLPDHL